MYRSRCKSHKNSVACRMLHTDGLPFHYNCIAYMPTHERAISLLAMNRIRPLIPTLMLPSRDKQLRHEWGECPCAVQRST